MRKLQRARMLAGTGLMVSTSDDAKAGRQPRCFLPQRRDFDLIDALTLGIPLQSRSFGRSASCRRYSRSAESSPNSLSDATFRLQQLGRQRARQVLAQERIERNWFRRAGILVERHGRP